MTSLWQTLGLVAIFSALGCMGYNEAPCKSSGGMCQSSSRSCSGSYVSGKCPTQSSRVKCCIPAPASTAATSCGALGGQCMYYPSCTGISVSRMCPGSASQRCCVHPEGVDVIAQHLNKNEGGLYLTGYIPTSGSGVTIATGVDLGQQDVSSLRRLGVSAALITKLNPYLGFHTRNAVHNAGLNEKNLKLTLDEGVALDNAFKNGLLRRIKKYSAKLSQKGQAVMASLSHWCYAAVRSRPDQKCYIRGCPNYLKEAFTTGKGRDSDLKAGLLSLKTCAAEQGRPRWVSVRLQHEANIL